MARRSRQAAQPTRREAEVALALSEAAGRGEDHAAVAHRLGIRVATVRWWASQIRCREARRARSRSERAPRLATPSFVEVHVEATRTAPGFEAVLENGRQVRVPLGFDAGELARLVQVLERSC